MCNKTRMTSVNALILFSCAWLPSILFFSWKISISTHVWMFFVEEATVNRIRTLNSCSSVRQYFFCSHVIWFTGMHHQVLNWWLDAFCFWGVANAHGFHEMHMEKMCNIFVCFYYLTWLNHIVLALANYSTAIRMQKSIMNTFNGCERARK